ncbi:hypothetical protein CHU94_12985 [Rhodoferax sp. TH121]|uniref:hypothetical protein n=1 Tax=Rhodoferax sp. TH121 TaxID=2022803 RepID=UPI000B978B93|nr:hypothetical protein [Rhodoferax sp. TH121]OYQ40217.1 hypothetical protein CHU94_12985 [Rhodoferax sp. TH121]
MISRRHLVFIALASFVCIFIAAATAANGDYKAIAYDLSVGFIVSAIFYWMVVYLPESNRKKIIHSGLNEQYDSFRRSCISNFLILSSSQSYPHNDALLDQEEFKRYFKNKNEKGENRWDAVANGIQENEFYLREIVYELRMLNDEIRFVRSTLNIKDVEVYDFLGRLSREIARMESTTQDYDEIKSFCRFLWRIFTGWNWVSGYSKSNLIQEMLGRAK